ncbi:MAG: aminodeoxychorismate synthase component I [Alphaproteobacteria bacterium]
MTRISGAGPFALFDDNFTADGRSVLFEDPADILVVTETDEAAAAFAAIDRATANSLFVAGYFSYELSPTIDSAFVTHRRDENVPLIQVGFFRSRRVLTDPEVETFLAGIADSDTAALSDIMLTETRPDFLSNMARIRAYIEAGDTYQVNHTVRARFRFAGCPAAYYRRLRQAQQVNYGALLSFPDLTILSRSPELFFRKDGDRLTTKPMKGTAPRHRDSEADRAAAAFLQKDEKSLAENLMIVDLLRNDLSRIADPGTVAVDALFEVETYKTVHQMTSTISCRVSPEESLKYLFAGLFPCGSVTGAPKVRTMQIIRELESEPRGVYTGAIGYVTPDNDMRFSVPIRTITLQPDGRGELGIGAGIVYDSVPSDEYDETLLKARFAFGSAAGFDLLESMYGDAATGIRNLQAHLDRVETAARAFLFPFDRRDTEAALRAAASALDAPAKVRMTIGPDGERKIASQPLGEDTGPKHVVLWDVPTDSRDLKYAYKTTDRGLYNAAWSAAAERYGAYDVLFTNRKGELTEASRHNLFLRFGECFATPPLSCGVLPGVERAAFMADHPGKVDERVLYPDDLHKADEILLTNSVRGVVTVSFLPLTGNPTA